MTEEEWERWDAEVEQDSKDGKLDFLIRRALEAKAAGKLRDLVGLGNNLQEAGQARTV